MTMSDRIAVMRAGRIEQLGAPEDLYERPETEFVAGFLGVSNLLDGEVVGRRDGLMEVRLNDGTVVRVPGTEERRRGPVRIGVRPEKLRVTAYETDEPRSVLEGRNALEGSVLDASYVGVSTQYLVETRDGHHLTVYAQNLETSGASGGLADGQRVRVTWHPQHSFVIDMAEHEHHVHGTAPMEEVSA